MYVAIWMDLEGFMLTEVSQRSYICDLTYMWNLTKQKQRADSKIWRTNGVC